VLGRHNQRVRDEFDAGQRFVVQLRQEHSDPLGFTLRPAPLKVVSGEGPPSRTAVTRRHRRLDGSSEPSDSPDST
jgi:hypothetical protein